MVPTLGLASGGGGRDSPFARSAGTAAAGPEQMQTSVVATGVKDVAAVTATVAGISANGTTLRIRKLLP